jgi:non-ribosomal peptide synthase protein (TIGR01720 family)
MDPILAEFTELVRAARPKAPTIPFASNRTGTWITAAEATDPAYWAGHLRGTVRFAEGLETVLAGERRVLLEIGPGNTLTTLSSRIARGADAEPPVVVASMRHPRETERDHDRLMDAVGQLWLAHVRPDWAAVHRGEPRRRVPLPTYPFERSRHWIEPGNGPLLAGAAGAAGKTSDVASWFYAPSWKRAAPSVGRLELSAHDVLVVASGDDLGLAERLRALGKEVTTVDGAELSAHLAGRTNAPELVVHLLGAVRDDDGLETGLFSLLELAQAVVAAEWSTPIDVVVVTRGTQSVTGAETLFPEKAAVLAACQALSLETPNLTCRAIDVDGDTDPDAILRELGAGGAGVAGVAWRGRFRWTRAFEPLRVEAPDAGALPLRDGGHYLVTGGLGSIGLEVASTLARRARGARLVLVGRSPFPARADWDGWLAAHGDADDTSRRIAVLRSLEELGAQVRVVAADVTDRVRFARVVDEAEASFGALNGVVHAAGGEKTMAILAATTRVECEAQLRPKIAGLAVLEELLEGRTLDFCLVQSSLSSYLGALGMLGYVAAHHVVDAFVARHNRTSSQRWTSANWDNWLSWKEPEFLHTHGESAYFMTPEEGADALLRVLSLPPGTEVVVSTGSLEARLAEWARPARSESDRTGGDGASGGDLHARPALRTDWVAPTTPAELALARAWGEVLGIAEIGANDGFFELGGDSVLGLQIVAKVARAGFHVTPAQIFEHPTIAGLASVAQARQTERVVEGAVEGPAPLLPIQHWFFESDYPEPEHFNLPMLFEVPAGTTPEQLAEALAVVARHHDALRLRYRRTDAGVEQIHAAEAGAVDVSLLDLSNVAAPERADALRARADELHLGFDLEHGPLGRALLVRTGGEAPRVLWILHHLLVDVVSWRVLVEDVQAALASRPLPPKSTSYRRFGQALVEHAGSTAIERERAHWTALARIAPPRVPVDAAGARNVYASARTVTVSLDAERTRALLLDVPPVYETRIDEVLLAALALGFSRWSGGGGELFVDLEAHGRESVTPGLDLSRTVGWFTTLYPAHFVLPGDGRDLRETLRAIKEQVRRIPNHGVGFGVLRYLSPDAALREALRAIPKPELGFLYLGQFDAGGSGGPGGIGSSGMQVLEDASGRPCSPDAPRGHLLELACFVKGGRLEVELSYSTEHHERSSAEALTRAFVEELEALVAHCQDPEAGGRTPSDFPAARVSQASLDKLMSRIGRKPGG